MDQDSAGEPRFTQDEMSEILELAARLDGPLANPDEVSFDEDGLIGCEKNVCLMIARYKQKVHPVVKVRAFMSFSVGF